MTNTLHRFGKPENLKDDYIVFILTSKGANDVGALPKARDFLKTALKYGPVNMAGESANGSLHRPEKHLNLFSLYIRGRKQTVPAQQLIDEMGKPGRGLAVFDNQPPLPQTRDRQDRRQGHQSLRRRDPQGLRSLKRSPP